jgi:hypothetical protein
VSGNSLHLPEKNGEFYPFAVTLANDGPPKWREPILAKASGAPTAVAPTCGARALDRGAELPTSLAEAAQTNSRVRADLVRKRPDIGRFRTNHWPPARPAYPGPPSPTMQHCRICAALCLRVGFSGAAWVIQVHPSTPRPVTHAGRFDGRSGGGQLGLRGFGGHESGVGSASAADSDLVAGGGAFEVVAEVVAELVAADVD